jgi:hypothetical protein
MGNTHVKLQFNSNDGRVVLELASQRVLEHFQLPTLRLLCFFDDQDPPCFAQRFGAKYRGFHTPVRGSGFMPDYLSRHFFMNGDFAFDNVVYLRGATCATQVGAVITFAHELQHVMQYGNANKVLAANNLLFQHLPEIDPTSGLRAWDIPHEHDAMLVSKRIGEAVLGKDAVLEHANSQIAAGCDAGYWECFLVLSTSATFDLLKETDSLVQRYRPQLCRLRQTEVDFAQCDWWLAPSARRIGC